MSDPGPSGTVTRRIRKKRVFIHRQARELAKKILDMCIEEKRKKRLTVPIRDAFGRASRYTELGKRTLAVIQKEAQKGPLRSPSKKGRLCKKYKNMDVDNIDRSLIQRTIEEFYLINKVVPTCPKLLQTIREKIEFPWGVTSLRKLLREMGYKWLKCHNKRRVLVERPSVVFSRSKYLRKIYQYRQENKEIFFLNAAWIDNDLTFKKFWKYDGNENVSTDKNAKNRLILVHAGSRKGFLGNAKLLFEADCPSGEYHGQMNGANFEKWVNEMLIPNLPSNSVVVMDNAPYHNALENKVPKKSSTKDEMLEWLARHNVQAPLTMRKDELYHLIELGKPRERTFKIDQLIMSHGHDVVRLPQYMSDLNPFELAWATLKRIVIRHQNDNSELSLKKLRDVIDLALAQITEQDWRYFDDHVISLEQNYWERDALMEEAIDRFVTDIIEEEDSDEEDDSDTSIIVESDED